MFLCNPLFTFTFTFLRRLQPAHPVIKHDNNFANVMEHIIRNRVPKINNNDNKDIMYLKLIIYFSDIQKWNQMMSMMICLVISYNGWPDMFLQTVKKESRQCPLWSTFVTRQKRFVKLEWSNRILHSWPAVLQIFVWNTTSPSKECFTVYFQIVPWTFVLSTRHVIGISDFVSSNVKLCWKCLDMLGGGRA